MKKILSILICVVLGISSAYSAATITVKVHAENADGTLPVYGSVTLTKTKSKDGQGGTATTNKDGNTQISISANGSDGYSIPVVGVVGAYNPTITLSVNPDEDRIVEGIYLLSGDAWVPQGTSSFEITSSSTANKTYKVVFARDDAPKTISAATLSTLDIWTGTEKDGSYPYSLKRKIDLSVAFNGDVAAFDKLYIFGLTTGDVNNNINVASASTYSNAVTPCFVYAKNGNDYQLEATIANVNVPVKPAQFNITASGQKIYFTGYAPSISCGSTWDEKGVFFISGQGGIDLYFDNLQLFARPKSQDGTTNVTKQYFEVNDILDATILTREDVDGEISRSNVNVQFYTQGSGSVFCFQPIKNGSTFTPKIHLLNENLLESTQGVHLFVKVDFVLELDRNATQHSAPIQILHNENTIKTATELTIDDVWHSERTNGILNLARASARPAPTIDLGYSNTTLNINGGQLFLSNSFNLSDSYDVSYAISYRQKDMMDGLAIMYGLGDDQPGGTVYFNDGTINCKPLAKESFESTQGQKLFHNPESMKCPQNTYIRGGSFNCNVLACSATTSKGASPKNDKNGDALCIVSIPVASKNANGTAVLPNNWVDLAVAQGAKQASEVIYGGNGYSYYNTTSMTPETVTVDGQEQEVVNLMLPSHNICFKEVLTTPWVACFPYMSAKALSQTQEFGGDVEVPFNLSNNDGLTKVERTSKLLYGEIDHYLVNLITGENDAPYKYEVPGDGDSKPTLSLDLDAPGASSSVLNTQPFAVYDKVYMVMPLVANQWKMFVPPFDVANVYVIEPYTEANILAKFDANGDGKLTNSSSDNEVTKARYAQSYRNLDFLYSWVYSIYAMKSNSDIWSNDPNVPATGYVPSYGTFMKSWLDVYEGEEDAPTAKNCIQQLYHYKSNNEGYPSGMTRWDANFYLYEADDTEWTIGGSTMNTGWKEVPTISMKRKINEDHNVIMKKGGVYVMNFPSTIKNNEIYDYINTWDYWTGKYIILEGYPEEDIDTDGNGLADDKAQILSGSEYDWNGKALTETVLAPYETENVAALRGNTTFSKLDISGHDNAYVLNNYYRGKNVNEDISSKNMLDSDLPHNVYVDASSWSLELSPGEGFVLANIDAPAGMKPRAINIKTGEITYRDETTTSLPTIGGNNHMFVYNIEGGVGIVPVVEQQVSIYNAAGQLVTSEYLTDEVHISLPTGIYLIAGAQDQFKAVVK